jgi:uncharacterized protein YidB (DUF937 family)
MADQFARGMSLMRKHDPQAQEDGFGFVRAVADEHVADLVAAYAAEQDQGLKCWLLELVGEARSSEALPLLVAELRSDSESLSSWARVGLEKLNTPEARRVLWESRAP